eukprot:Rmarinus@m.19931
MFEAGSPAVPTGWATLSGSVSTMTPTLVSQACLLLFFMLLLQRTPLLRPTPPACKAGLRLPSPLVLTVASGLLFLMAKMGLHLRSQHLKGSLPSRSAHSLQPQWLRQSAMELYLPLMVARQIRVQT